MKINLVTLGSQGDVQPFVALGHGLVKAGQIESFGASHGLEFHALDGEFRKLQEANGVMEGNGDQSKLTRLARRR